MLPHRGLNYLYLLPAWLQPVVSDPADPIRERKFCGCLFKINDDDVLQMVITFFFNKNDSVVDNVVGMLTA